MASEEGSNDSPVVFGRFCWPDVVAVTISSYFKKGIEVT
jgi:hypothetical protein